MVLQNVCVARVQSLMLLGEILTLTSWLTMAAACKPRNLGDSWLPTSLITCPSGDKFSYANILIRLWGWLQNRNEGLDGRRMSKVCEAASYYTMPKQYEDFRRVERCMQAPVT